MPDDDLLGRTVELLRLCARGQLGMRMSPPQAAAVVGELDGAHRAVAAFLGVESGSLPADVRVLVDRCADAEAERDRLAEQLDRLQAEYEVAEMRGRAYAVEERDRLAEQVRRVWAWLDAMDKEGDRQYYAAHVAEAGQRALDGGAS